MSGGKFNYSQYQLNDIADTIEQAIADELSTERNEYDEPIAKGWTPETLARFAEAVHTIRQAAEMAQRVDWLLSGDDGEETFHRRWHEEVRAYWRQDHRKS